MATKSKKVTRRKFIGNISKASLATGAAVSVKKAEPVREIKKKFLHHVFFWLKKDGSKEDTAKLIEGLRKLSKVITIQQFHIGIPADTHRDVVERSYAVSWFVLLKNAKDQESYQNDPIHLQFVKDYSYLWDHVKVHDTVDAV